MQNYLNPIAYNISIVWAMNIISIKCGPKCIMAHVFMTVWHNIGASFTEDIHMSEIQLTEYTHYKDIIMSVMAS